MAKNAHSVIQISHGQYMQSIWTENVKLEDISINWAYSMKKKFCSKRSWEQLYAGDAFLEHWI